MKSQKSVENSLLVEIEPSEHTQEIESDDSHSSGDQAEDASCENRRDKRCRKILDIILG